MRHKNKKSCREARRQMAWQMTFLALCVKTTTSFFSGLQAHLYVKKGKKRQSWRIYKTKLKVVFFCKQQKKEYKKNAGLLKNRRVCKLYTVKSPKNVLKGSNQRRIGMMNRNRGAADSKNWCNGSNRKPVFVQAWWRKIASALMTTMRFWPRSRWWSVCSRYKIKAKKSSKA